MNDAPAFSGFRSLLDTWDDHCFWETLDDNLSNLLDGRGYIMFFKKENEIFGAPEESRIMFARMKTPEKQDTDDLMEPGGFLAFNLLKSLMGDMSPNLFGPKDLKKIKIIDREDAEKKLKNKIKDDDKKSPSGHPLRMVMTKMIRIIPNMMGGPEDGGPTMIRLKDKK
jgi:hypothetical protein